MERKSNFGSVGPLKCIGHWADGVIPMVEIDQC